MGMGIRLFNPYMLATKASLLIVSNRLLASQSKEAKYMRFRRGSADLFHDYAHLKLLYHSSEDAHQYYPLAFEIHTTRDLYNAYIIVTPPQFPLDFIVLLLASGNVKMQDG